VYYAHQRGILHRDIKPANILLDAARQPHITDFGLAKRLNREAEPATLGTGQESLSTADYLGPKDGGLTQTGSILGTPSYMAPEQASGQKGLVTTAADVYSLGAVLYELLAGRPPFRGATPLETLRQLMEKEPEPPRASHPEIERDLETICLKCLQKDPRQRYASALALAEDLERFLTGKPILARPVGNVERVWRWCRRQPALASASGLAAAALVAVVVGSILFAFREARHAEELSYEQAQTQAALKEARRQTRTAERQQALAEESFRQAHQAVNDCVKVSNKLEKAPYLQPLRKELLEAALRYYQTFLEQRDQDPKLRKELADTHRRVGDINSAIDSQTRALQAFQKSLEVYEDLLRENPADVRVQEEAAQIRHRLGIHQPTLEAALKVHQENLTRIEQALRDHPDNLSLQATQTLTYNSLGVTHRKMGHLNESLRCFGLACDLQQGLVVQHPDNPAVARNLALYINNLGIYQDDTGHGDEALKSFQRALAIRQKLAQADPKNELYQLDVSASSRDIGMIQSNKGQKKEALEAFQQARAIRERLVRANPSVTRYKADLAFSHRDVGRALRDLGRLDEALVAFEKSRVLQDQLIKGNPTVAQYQFDLAQSQLMAGDVYQVKKHQAEALGHWFAWGVYLATKHQADALQAYQQARIILEELVQKHPQNLDYTHILGVNLDNLGVTLKQTGQLKEAATALEQAVAYQKTAFGKAPQVKQYRDFLDRHYVHLAEVHRAAGNAAAAVAVSLERRQLWEGHGRPLVQVARDLARAAPVVGRGKTDLSAAEQAERRHYRDLALETLRQAVANGYKDGDYLRKQKDFEPLRQRAEFQELVQSIKK
jgi:serine/threonine-protein kinase